MTTSLWHNTLFALIPALLVLVGGVSGVIYTPSAKLKSMTQHFVSGIVFAAVAVELLPKIAINQAHWTIAIGFVAGTLVMLFLMWLTHRTEHSQHAHASAAPLGLLFAMLVDLFIDGMLIGVAFIAGKQSGILIALAFSTCAFLLGLATTLTLKNNQTSLKVCSFWLLLLAVAIPIGTLVGSYFIMKLPASWLTETLAFGVAALLYLAAEELLSEAHEVEDTPLITSMFFWGFLVILLFKV